MLDKELKKIFTIIFKLRPNNIKKTTNFRNVKNWDSLSHVKLIMSIESKFKISIDPDEALKLLSFNDIYNFIKKKNKIK